MTRGDIVMVCNEQATGHEQYGTRPAVIVSNNYCNKYSPVVELVYTTTRQKNLTTHTRTYPNHHTQIPMPMRSHLQRRQVPYL